MKRTVFTRVITIVLVVAGSLLAWRHNWKTSYHNARGMLNCIKMLRTK
jgi:hypothetical protein